MNLVANTYHQQYHEDNILASPAQLAWISGGSRLRPTIPICKGISWWSDLFNHSSSRAVRFCSQVALVEELTIVWYLLLFCETFHIPDYCSSLWQNASSNRILLHIIWLSSLYLPATKLSYTLLFDRGSWIGDMGLVKWVMSASAFPFKFDLIDKPTRELQLQTTKF